MKSTTHFIVTEEVSFSVPCPIGGTKEQNEAYWRECAEAKQKAVEAARKAGIITIYKEDETIEADGSREVSCIAFCLGCGPSGGCSCVGTWRVF